MVNSNQENINVMVFENPEFGRVRTIVDKNGGYFHINPGETVGQIKARFEKVLEYACTDAS